MDNSRREEWQGGPGPAEQVEEHQQQNQPPSQPLFGPVPSVSQQQPLPPPGSFYTSNAPLPPIGSIGTSPASSTRPPLDLQHEQAPHPPNPPPSTLAGTPYSLPSIHQEGQVMDHRAEYERERDMQDARQREFHARDFHERSRQEQREQERRDWEMRQQQERDQHAQHRGHADTAQIHQPVPVPGVPPAHGPNGILAGAVGPQGNPPQYGIAPPPAARTPQPPQMFGLPSASSPQPPHPPQMSQNLVDFHGTPQMQGQGPPGSAPGQQPILNDALSYLDQVKIQFHGQSEVYNQFLDIMKDFKSQAIDTPGVIRRVSHLFAGNSQLIQGFNTFLPMGYRIECNEDGNPDGIRVLTPQGTFIDTSGNQLQPPSGHRATYGDAQAPYDMHDRNAGQMDGPYYSPSLRPEEHRGHRHLSPFEGSAQRESHHSGVNAALLAHQEEQRGVVAQLQNAANASDQGQMPLQQSMSPSLQNGTINNGGDPNAGRMRDGPVEFNHAISYVNKIKNRFVGQPDIYKNFLEILQTYQRESRPIQDVYSQVTTLFEGAPDLLRDFKQFLPETSAPPKQAMAEEYATSHMRGDHQERPSRQTPKPDQHRLPPVGNFQPTPTANRDVKRKRGDRGGPVPAPDFGPSRGGYAANKRVKQTQAPPVAAPKQQVLVDAPAVEPTLIPELPAPMHPGSTTAASSEELGFFDRVKKHLGNKSSMNEWLKLCNLFSQDLIDVNTLVSRSYEFIGDNADLFNWFKTFVNYTGQDTIIENRARPESGRVSLNNCRGYGPSYRLLPKRDRQAVCSGRDELCNMVLNDAWASHPTWSSEDSGFIAHRKNAHEEGLHRIEEERHDYDHHIAVVERGIQILEPIAQQIANTPKETLGQLKLGQEFAVNNHFVFKASLSKIYGREPASGIIANLPDRPASVVPIVLLRMRQKLEEWKMVQREWEKVWRDQTQKMFWKSLDHQGIAAKINDKRQFQTKTLQNEMHIRLAENQKLREKGLKAVPWQMKITFADKDVLLDASYLLLTYAEHMFNAESTKIQAFIKEFVPAFFDLDAEAFNARMQEVLESTTPNEEVEDDTPPSEASVTSRATRKPNGKKDDLRRGVLDKNRKTVRGDRESSIASGSRASTPDVTSTVEEDAVEAAEAAEEEVEHKTWFNHPIDGNMHKTRNLKPNESFKRNTYSLYANLNIFCFFKMFVTLYERLLAVKQAEQEIHDAIAKERKQKPADDFAIVDRRPTDFFGDVGPNANYYQQVLEMLEEIAKQNTDAVSMSQVEDLLRRYYLSRGYGLYTFEKMMSALTRFAIGVFSSDPKERSNDIMGLFLKDRKKESTTHQDEVTYRKQVEKYVKDGDIFRIAYFAPTSTATVRIMRRQENVFDLRGPEFSHVPGTVSHEDSWRMYIVHYSFLEPTEGVPQNELRKVFLARSLSQAQKRVERSLEKMQEKHPENPLPTHSLSEWRTMQLDNVENLSLRISPTNFHITWGADENSADQWISRPYLRSLARRQDAAAKATADGAEEKQQHDEDGEAKFLEMFVMNNSWMADKSRDEVDQANREFREWRGDGDVVMEES